ncbi:MAG: hypothetical protein WCA39_00510 [Nitrososphaeraceae archaeon]
MIVRFQLGMIKQIKFIRNSSTNNSNNKRIGFPNSKCKFITIVGIIIVLIGIAGAIYYGSEFVRSEIRPTTQLPYTNIPSNSNAISMVTEIGFVVPALVGFGMLSYAIANKLDKPSEFNQS